MRCNFLKNKPQSWLPYIIGKNGLDYRNGEYVIISGYPLIIGIDTPSHIECDLFSDTKNCYYKDFFECVERRSDRKKKA